jgi:hypothetical protein
LKTSSKWGKLHGASIRLSNSAKLPFRENIAVKPVADNQGQWSKRGAVQPRSIRGLQMLCGLALSLLALTGHAANGYEVTYTGTFVPQAGHVDMQIDVGQARGQLRELNLRAPTSHYSGFSGPGKVVRRDSRVVWRVPRAGGTLQYQVAVNNQRTNGNFDARMTADWALLRLDDLVPSARARARRGAESSATLFLKGPAGWAVETPYGPMRDGPIQFAVPERRFDRPTGWAMAGKLGIRREEIAGRQVAVVAPSGSGYPRVPTLAFLNWTLPDLVSVFPRFPKQLLIVSASDKMWRGALSGPRSLYLHGDRPMISENATSPLLHEMVHVGSRMSSKRHDWIVEGLAEYYGIEILRRSGGLSQTRFDLALASLEKWAESASATLAHPSSGANTASAVLLFHALNQELLANGSNLDAVVEQMLERGPKVTRRGLVSAARRSLGRRSSVLNSAPATQTLR